MKLRNKKTGEIGYTAVLRSKAIVVMDENAIQLGSYTSLAELNAEWEDVPEKPKEYWYVSCDGRALKATTDQDEYNEKHNSGHVSIGNYFGTKEEAEKAVEKLKSWKRLKDNGFRFETFGYDRETVKNGRVNMMIRATFDEKYGDGSVKLSDLDLLFGGEE